MKCASPISLTLARYVAAASPHCFTIHVSIIHCDAASISIPLLALSICLPSSLLTPHAFHLPASFLALFLTDPSPPNMARGKRSPKQAGRHPLQRKLNQAQRQVAHHRHVANRIADTLTADDQSKSTQWLQEMPAGFAIVHLESATNMRFSHLGDNGGEHAGVIDETTVDDDGECTDDFEDSMRKAGYIFGCSAIPYLLADAYENGTAPVIELVIYLKPSAPMSKITHLLAQFEGYDPMSISCPLACSKLIELDDNNLEPDHNGVLDSRMSKEDWHDEDNNPWKQWCRLLVFKKELLGNL